jgi:hypothetical protein
MFISQPQETHFEPEKHIFRYLKGVKDYGLMFEQGIDNVLNGYIDLD